MSEPNSPTVAVFVPDLMDQSKVRAAFPEAERLRSVAQLTTCEASVVIVDLNRSGVIEAIPEVAGNVIGFASHVDDDMIALAWAAGASNVLPRSVFFKRIAEGSLGLPDS